MTGMDKNGKTRMTRGMGAQAERDEAADDEKIAR